MLLLQIDASTSNSIAPMITAFFNEFESITKTAEQWITVGKILGMIGAYIYIFKKFAPKIMNGETFNLTDVAYPIFIAFLLSVYTPVAKGIENIFTSTYNATYISNTVDDIYSSVSKNRAKIQPIDDTKKAEASAAVNQSETDVTTAEDYLKQDTKPDEFSMLTKTTDLLLGAYDSIINGINSLIIGVLTTILEIIIIVCIATIFFLAKLYISFLYIFGPFSIAMSLIPGFENSITNWFQKYISYSLWMPVAATIAELTKDVLSMSLMGGASNVAHVGINGVGGLLIATAMLIVSMLAVPKIVSNIISTSVGSSSTSSKALTVMQLVNKGGGSVASGGASAIVNAGTNAISQGVSSANNSGNPAQAPEKPI